MTMNPDPQAQRPGLFGRIGNFFGADDPNAGQATDPFANLSRAQRTMLGFAALRDAAASLEGRDSSYFNEALGGFEAARERERLREQGEFANRNQQMMNLIQMQALARAVGDPTLEQFASDQLATIMGGAGGVTPAAGGAVPPMQPPGDFTGGVVPQGLPSGPQGVTGAPPTVVVYDSAGTVQPQPYTGEAEVVQTGGAPAVPAAQPAAPTDPIAAIDAELANIEGQIEAIIQGQPTSADVTVGAIAGIPVGDDPQAQARLARLYEQESRLLAERQAAQQALATQQAETEVEQEQIEQQAERAENVILPQVQTALDFLVQGFTVDDQGRQVPVFNPILTTRLGRGAAAELQSPEYQAFEGALIPLRIDALVETLESVTAGQLTEAERRAFEAAQGQLDPSNPIGTYAALQNMQRIAQEAMARAGRTQSGGNTPTVTWD